METAFPPFLPPSVTGSNLGSKRVVGELKKKDEKSFFRTFMKLVPFPWTGKPSFTEIAVRMGLPADRLGLFGAFVESRVP